MPQGNDDMTLLQSFKSNVGELYKSARTKINHADNLQNAALLVGLPAIMTAQDKIQLGIGLGIVALAATNATSTVSALKTLYNKAANIDVLRPFKDKETRLGVLEAATALNHAAQSAQITLQSQAAHLAGGMAGGMLAAEIAPDLTINTLSALPYLQDIDASRVAASLGVIALTIHNRKKLNQASTALSGANDDPKSYVNRHAPHIFNADHSKVNPVLTELVTYSRCEAGVTEKDNNAIEEMLSEPLTKSDPRSVIKEISDLICAHHNQIADQCNNMTQLLINLRLYMSVHNTLEQHDLYEDETFQNTLETALNSFVRQHEKFEQNTSLMRELVEMLPEAEQGDLLLELETIEQATHVRMDYLEKQMQTIQDILNGKVQSFDKFPDWEELDKNGQAPAGQDDQQYLP